MLDGPQGDYLTKSRFVFGGEGNAGWEHAQVLCTEQAEAAQLKLIGFCSVWRMWDMGDQLMQQPQGAAGSELL